MSTRLRSFSKINLGLAVGPLRPDGFHALTTLYQTLALHDLVTVTARLAPQTSITLTSNHPGVPRTERRDAEKNTAYRIVDLALRHLNLTADVAIDIQKRLPVQGGLGAGSANAAAALLGLEKELNLTLSGPDRLALAAQVGSDVPLFLLGGSVLGLSRGEEVYPLPDLPVTPCVVAIPSVGVSTAAAFRALDARPAQTVSSRPEQDEVLCSGETRISDASGTQSLTSAPNTSKLEQLSRALSAAWSPSGANLVANPQGTHKTQVTELQEPSPSGITRRTGDLAENLLLTLVRTGIENDFEQVVFHEHPSLRSTKRDLVGDSSVPEGSRAIYAALSGSGSALFGLYRSMADASAAQQRVQSSGTQALLTETLPRPEYWRTMLD
jgi:4-diphosphocytidyl-2-C-methyl-D-erythritol kinase